MKIHIVQKEETLSILANRYGIELSRLMEANAQLSSPEMAMPGMKIKIPASPTPIKEVKDSSTSKEIWKQKAKKERSKKKEIKADNKEQQYVNELEFLHEQFTPHKRMEIPIQIDEKGIMQRTLLEYPSSYSFSNEEISQCFHCLQPMKMEKPIYFLNYQDNMNGNTHLFVPSALKNNKPTNLLS